MDKFQKNKKNIISGLNIAIILSIIVLVANLLYSLAYSSFNVKTALAFIIVGWNFIRIIILSKKSSTKRKDAWWSINSYCWYCLSCW